MTSQDLRPVAARANPVVAAGIATLGLAVVVAGSFLPWVVSGTVSRNSYQVAGLADRIGLLDGAAGTLLGWWPWFGPCCIVPILVGCLRWWRVAGGLAVVCGLAAAGLAAMVLILTHGRTVLGVSLATAGPVTMLAGAALAIGGGTGLLIRGGRR